MKTVLSIAGSDCCGGAGIQADIKTCMAFGVYCTTAITAVTAQNPYRFINTNYVGDDVLLMQLEAILESATPDAIKIGMLPTVSAIKIVAETILRHRLTNIVLDPVIAATSAGGKHTEIEKHLEEWKEAMITRLFPLCTLITPNLPELANFMGQEINNLEQQGYEFLEKSMCKGALLVKGGHGEGDICKDILLCADGVSTYESKRIDTNQTHGTGCTLSSAIAGNLALGHDIKKSVRIAKEFTRQCILKAADADLYSHNGPLIHF